MLEVIAMRRSSLSSITVETAETQIVIKKSAH